MITKELEKRVLELYSKEPVYSKIADVISEEFPISHRTARHYVSKIVNYSENSEKYIVTDKKVGTFSWREAVNYIETGQKLFDKAKSSQSHGTVKIATDEPIYIMVLGDGHFGSWGTDYEILKRITDEIINTPNLYVILVGDLLQMSIKMRNMLEVSDNALPPKYQMMLLDSWLSEISHKVICSTWDNHSVMREEQMVGYSTYSHIFERTTMYFNGIGHLDLIVGNQNYKIALAHFFRGYSLDNPCHGGMRYMRRAAIDREICLAGDSHVPGIIKYTDGEKTRCVLNCGTAQTNSGYAKRFFSLYTHPVFPVLKLDPKEHEFTPYWNLKEALK